ncbi:ferrous iron transport protein A [Thermodesulfobacterium sp. TA1]|uniref:FeoA family protein n=1 Tax=Thermodesulfobacterium sp. TA1 TaxID=2234087 RepID=UPI00123289AF|nr:FeoA family protein [Thermodesulfobacterium sp. TA1]QER41360.1 ferrous iron transport protein A [Thermodesulfobacterium sp. TA1]
MFKGREEKRTIPLALLREGEVGKIYSMPDLMENIDFSGGRKGCGGRGNCFKGKGNFCQRIVSMGLKPGQMVEVKQNQPGNPILLKVGESLIALSRRIAMWIMVIKND